MLKVFNPFSKNPLFLRVCINNRQRLKTQWERENLLVTSNFSFSPSVLYTVTELSSVFLKFEIVVCILFWFGRGQIGHLGKGLKNKNK